MSLLVTSDSGGKALFTTRLLEWFAGAMRPLPWRVNYTPYEVWISEVMLQQTQMHRAVPYFTRWMERFPGVDAVASAPLDHVLKAWEGLGYYSRARNLHAAARRIMAEHDGLFPPDYEGIRNLPGIGEYTAGAIASIAYNQPYPAVDANVERVFSRLYDIDSPLALNGGKDFIRRTVQAMLAHGQPRLFNQALMELGALVCAKNPECNRCPVAALCEAKRLGTTRERPVRKASAGYTQLEMATGILWHQGRLLLQKRPPYGVWAGLWEFPGGCLETGESPEQALVREFMEETELSIVPGAKIGVVQHAYTTCRVTLHGYFCRLATPAEKNALVLHAATESRWVTPAQLEEYTMPSGHRKLLALLEKKDWP